MKYRHLSIDECQKILKEQPSDFLNSVREQVQNETYNAVLESFDVCQNRQGPLKDIPILVKDNLALENQIIGCGSKYLQNHRSHYTATVNQRLLDAGARLLGRTNMDEFAMGSSTEHSAFGPTLNPWDTSRVPGGSSGGSAAAVAAGLVPVALGTSTGGSVRQPAAFCGVVGYKPSYGLLSRYGLVAFASSLDQVGIFSHRVDDVATLMNVMSGEDPRDSTSLPGLPDWTLNNIDLSSIRIGTLSPDQLKGVDTDILDAFAQTRQWFVDQGAQVADIQMPHLDKGVPVYYVVALAEASANLARYDGIRYGLRASADRLQDIYSNSRHDGLGAEVKRRIMLGTHVLSAGFYDAYYTKARRVQRLIQQDHEQVFENFDVLLWPTTPTTAFEFGSRSSPVEMYLSDIFTVCANLSGIPALSIPVGLDGNGLPIGMNLSAPLLGDVQLLSVARAYESANPFDHKALT